MFIVVSAVIIFNIFSHAASSLAVDSCSYSNQTCGSINVTYPNRLTSRPDCPSFSSFFELQCNSSTEKLYLNNVKHYEDVTPLEVKEINNLRASSLAVDSCSCSNQTCGSINVTYPFRLTSCPNCPSFSSFFELQCDSSTEKLYLNHTKHYEDVTPLEVKEINNLNGNLIVDISNWNTSVLRSWNFNITEFLFVIDTKFSIELPAFPGPYIISDDNVFGTFGCMLGMLVTEREVGGCYVSCQSDVNNSMCGNHTCCVSHLSQGSSSRFASYALETSPYANTDMCGEDVCSNSHCSLFHPNYTNFADQSYHLKLNWALPAPTNQTTGIQNEILQSPDYACCNTANHRIVEGVPGYLCSCNPGYAGDGYFNGIGCNGYLCSCDPGYAGDGYSNRSGCSDVDECRHPSMNDCIQASICLNTEGSYTCKCTSRFYVGDGRESGSGCKFPPAAISAFEISGAVLGLTLLISGFIFLVKRLVLWWRQRHRRKNFLQNGGLKLQEFIAARGKETARIFTGEELEVATKNYSDEMKIGVGGFGTVFKGTLENARVVAVKKANRGGDGYSEQFLNEIAILMHINHKHIVRLMGCCLETATPMLVYEYVPNGNVAENLALQAGDGVMGWEQRLKVARQTAEALAYLQVAASPPILHRDVKSTNVLLDDNFDAKVADFGVSRLVPDGVENVFTAVQGTIGYLDPEYFQSLQLTHKSDVYSFGVMLVELITGLKPVDNHGREPRFASLALFFIHHMQDGRGEELIDLRLENLSDTAPHTRSSIMSVATLACRCLAPLGIDRPSMSHVARQLHYITKSLMQGANMGDDDEALPLLPSSDYEGVMVAKNAQYFVQSTSQSMSIEYGTLPLAEPR